MSLQMQAGNEARGKSLGCTLVSVGRGVYIAPQRFRWCWVGCLVFVQKVPECASEPLRVHFIGVPNALAWLVAIEYHTQALVQQLDLDVGRGNMSRADAWTAAFAYVISCPC
jgi:hypothetical protein